MQNLKWITVGEIDCYAIAMRPLDNPKTMKNDPHGYSTPATTQSTSKTMKDSSKRRVMRRKDQKAKFMRIKFGER